MKEERDVLYLVKKRLVLKPEVRKRSSSILSDNTDNTALKNLSQVSQSIVHLRSRGTIKGFVEGIAKWIFSTFILII